MNYNLITLIVKRFFETGGRCSINLPYKIMVVDTVLTFPICIQNVADAVLTTINSLRKVSTGIEPTAY